MPLAWIFMSLTLSCHLSQSAGPLDYILCPSRNVIV